MGATLVFKILFLAILGLFITMLSVDKNHILKQGWRPGLIVAITIFVNPVFGALGFFGKDK